MAEVIGIEDLLSKIVQIAAEAIPGPGGSGVVCGVDSLEADGYGVSIQMAMAPRYTKRYIFGGGIRQCAFTAIAQAPPGKGKLAIMWLDAISQAFANRPRIAPGVRLVESEETTPSIVARMQDGTVRYGTTITITYPEG